MAENRIIGDAPLYTDAPIESREQDLLGRVRFAEAVADQLVSARAVDGFVVGVTGPWGNGKTSVINMALESARERDGELLVLHFNPWLYSSTEELVVRFLFELGSAISEEQNFLEKYVTLSRARAAAGRLRDYAEVVKPIGGVVGTVAAVAGGAAGRLAGETSSAIARRDAAKKALRELGRRVVVVIDDIDRVEDPHIREVVRLVNLIGDFPNCVYLLGYMTSAVARAVGEGNEEVGRSYLEKIVQAEYALPEIPDWLIHQTLVGAIQAIIDSFPEGTLGPFDEGDWQNLYLLGIRPLFSHIREIHRYANAVPVPLKSIGNEVAVADVLALEALRMFEPESWAEVGIQAEHLTATTRRFNDPDPFNAVAEKARAHAPAVRAMLEVLFRNRTFGASAKRQVAHG